MKHLVFSGCSFTENFESWAHMPISTLATNIALSKVDWWSTQHKIDFNAAYNGANSLSPEKYTSNIIAESSGSNVLIVRKLIHFIEHYDHNIDTIIFQITGFDRRELLISDQTIIEQTHTDCNDGEGVRIDDLTYLKQDTPSCNYAVVKDENPAPNYVRKLAAYFYSTVHEPWEYRVRNIEALQMLTIFCLAHSIRIAYFHGWNNYPIETSSYFDKKYQRYVKPYLLSESCLLDYANNTLNKNKVLGPDGGHPSISAHKKYWNDVVYPFIVN